MDLLWLLLFCCVSSGVFTALVAAFVCDFEEDDPYR